MALQVQHLGAVGAVGNDLPVQLLLDAGILLQGAQRRDVLHKAQVALVLAVCAGKRHVAYQSVDQLAIRADQAEFDVQAVAARDVVGPVPLHAFTVLRVDQAQPAEVDEVLGVQAEDALQRCIDVSQQAGCVDAKDPDGEHTGQCGQQALVFVLCGRGWTVRFQRYRE